MKTDSTNVAKKTKNNKINIDGKHLMYVNQKSDTLIYKVDFESIFKESGVVITTPLLKIMILLISKATTHINLGGGYVKITSKNGNTMECLKVEFPLREACAIVNKLDGDKSLSDFYKILMYNIKIKGEKLFHLMSDEGETFKVIYNVKALNTIYSCPRFVLKKNIFKYDNRGKLSTLMCLFHLNYLKDRQKFGVYVKTLYSSIEPYISKHDLNKYSRVRILLNNLKDLSDIGYLKKFTFVDDGGTEKELQDILDLNLNAKNLKTVYRSKFRFELGTKTDLLLKQNFFNF